MNKVLVVFGTRPEAIKMAPIIKVMKKRNIPYTICITAQHRQMLDQVLKVFDIIPDIDLNIMKRNQNLPKLSSNILKKIEHVLKSEKPSLVLVQGDTTTTFVTSLAAFYSKIPIGHVEAGLRTSNKFSPYPEEMNRVLTSKLADFHFAPTSYNSVNLSKEGITEKVFVTGNTVIDALFLALKNSNGDSFKKNRKILITCHRRENFGIKMENIFRAINILSEKFSDLDFIFPVHLNPNVQKTAKKILNNLPNVHLIKPIEYLEFITLMRDSYIILTDSGGIQEEAPSLGIPVLLLREDTERPEGIWAGTTRLVGSDEKKIVSEFENLLNNKKEYEKMSNVENPFGDGKASERIVEIIKNVV